MTRDEFEPLGELFKLLPRICVLKTSVMPELGENVYTEDGKVVGYVSDVFGPVTGFYIVVRLTEELEELKIGSTLYRRRGAKSSRLHSTA